MATQEVMHIRAILLDLMNKKQSTTPIYIDNQEAKAIAENPVIKQRSKHIDIKYHFTREKISQGIVTLHYVPTNENIADCLTKPVPNQTLQNAKLKIFGLWWNFIWEGVLEINLIPLCPENRQSALPAL